MTHINSRDDSTMAATLINTTPPATRRAETSLTGLGKEKSRLMGENAMGFDITSPA